MSEFFLFRWISAVVLCCVVLKGKLTTCEKVSSLEYFGGWKGFVIDEWGSYAFSCVTPITVWVVSQNESNCLSENKMVSTLNLISFYFVTFLRKYEYNKDCCCCLLYVVQSNILWLSILLSYHYRCNVVFTNNRFPVSFLLYIATQKNLTKSLLWTVLRILLSPKK